jgi:hypothetical protein
VQERVCGHEGFCGCVDQQLEATLLILLQQMQVVAPAGVRLLPAAADRQQQGRGMQQLGRKERRGVREHGSLWCRDRYLQKPPGLFRGCRITSRCHGSSVNKVGGWQGLCAGCSIDTVLACALWSLCSGTRGHQQ